MYLRIFYALFLAFSLNAYDLNATGVGPAPVALDDITFVDDVRVNHLPQPMREGALRIYDGFVRIAERQNGHAAGEVAIPVGRSVIDELAPLHIPAAGGSMPGIPVVNLMDTPFMRFIDRRILENGWGTPPVDAYSGEALVDFESIAVDARPEPFVRPVSGERLPDGREVPDEGIPLVPSEVVMLMRDEAEIGNPVAQYFRAIMRRNGIRGGAEMHVAADVVGARSLLVESMRSLNYHAARILAEGTGDIEAYDPAQTYRDFLGDDFQDKVEVLENMINGRGKHAFLTAPEKRFLSDLVLSLPGNTQRWHELLNSAEPRLENALYQAGKPPVSYGRIGYNLTMGVAETAAALGYFAYSSSTDDGATWGEGAYFAMNAVISWLEVADEALWAYDRDLFSIVTCGRWQRRDTLGIPIAFPAETFAKEAKLSSLL